MTIFPTILLEDTSNSLAMHDTRKTSMAMTIFHATLLENTSNSLAMHDTGFLVSRLFSLVLLLITLSNSGFSCRIYARRQDPGMNQG